jgi:serpin B
VLTRRTALTAALATSLLLPSCTSNTVADGPEKPPRENLHVEAPAHRPPPPSAAQRVAVAKSSNALGVDLMKTVGRSPGNYVLSPMSISMALSMAFAGASGETEAEMRRVLHLEGSVAEIAAASGGYIQAMEELPAPLTLRIANRLFGERSAEFEPTFVGLTSEGFGAPLVRVDFLGAPDAARVAINDWAAYETEQHITGLLPEGAVTTDSRLVLANATSSARGRRRSRHPTVGRSRSPSPTAARSPSR